MKKEPVRRGDGPSHPAPEGARPALSVALCIAQAEMRLRRAQAQKKRNKRKIARYWRELRELREALERRSPPSTH